MPTKYPIIDFFQLAREIAGNKELKPIYLIYGNESYLQNMILDEFKNRFKKENLSVNYETFYGENINFSHLANSVRMLPLGAGKQCIIIKQIEKLKAPLIKKLNYLIDNLSLKDDKIIILLFYLQKKMPSNISLDKIKQLGVVACFQKPKSFQVREWIKLKCSENQKYMSPEAVYYLQSLTDNEMGQINNEIEKLFCYFDSVSSKIEKKDIVNIFYGSAAANIFDFVDAIGEKETESALGLLKNLASSEYHELSLLAMVNRQVKLLLQSKRYINNPGKLKGELNLPQFVVNKLIKQSQKYHVEELKSAFGYLLDAEIKLKTGYFDPVIVLEQLVIKITN
ncbi:MAG: DNA polymerase III subunit delta [Atribacterota bacterium]